MPTLQQGQGFVWTPEGLKTEELATEEDLSPEVKDLIDRTNKNISERERQEYYARTGRDQYGRLVGKQPLESEDWKFAAALATLRGLGAIKTTMDVVDNPAVANSTIGAILGTTAVSSEIAGDAMSYWDLLSGKRKATPLDIAILAAPGTLIKRIGVDERTNRIARHVLLADNIENFDYMRSIKRRTKRAPNHLSEIVDEAHKILDEFDTLSKMKKLTPDKKQKLKDAYIRVLSKTSEDITPYLKQGGQLPKFQPGGEIPEITPAIVTQDSEFNKFLMTLPDNLRLTPEKDYHMYQYWKLGGKPKDFNEGIDRGMFTWDNSDKNYHAGSIVEDRETGIYHFIKPKHHPTVKYELDWYNKGLETLEGGEQRPLQGEDRKFWEDFRSKHQLDSTDVDYRYVPRNKQGGTLPYYLKHFNYDTTKEN